MSDKLKKLQIKKLIQEYVFIRSDLEYKQTIVDENTTIFLEEFYKISGTKPPLIDKSVEFVDLKLKKEINTDFNQNKIIDFKKDKTIKKIYREVSKMTHPDRDSYGYYTGIFGRATIAYESGNLIELLEICEKIDVPYEIGEEDLIKIKEKIVDVQKQIKILETSFVYLWWANPNEEIRRLIIQQYHSNQSKVNK